MTAGKSRSFVGLWGVVAVMLVMQRAEAYQQLRILKWATDSKGTISAFDSTGQKIRIPAPPLPAGGAFAQSLPSGKWSLVVDGTTVVFDLIAVKKSGDLQVCEKTGESGGRIAAPIGAGTLHCKPVDP